MKAGRLGRQDSFTLTEVQREWLNRLSLEGGRAGWGEPCALSLKAIPEAMRGSLRIF